MATKPGLAPTQRWMQSVIMHPGSDEEAVASEVAQGVISAREFPQVVPPSKTLSSFERLGIYRQMYLARLREALANDFLGVSHFLSDEAFTELVAGYIRAFPSRSYTLNRLGDHFPEYIRSAPGIPRRGFVYDLARLELALSQLFDARESHALTQEAIAAVPFEAWEKARLKPIEAFRLLSFRYPVSAYLQSVRVGTTHPSIRRKDQWMVAYRRSYRLWQLDLTKPAYELLQALASGLVLGEALKNILARMRGTKREDKLFSWFREWVAQGLFQAVELPNA